MKQLAAMLGWMALVCLGGVAGAQPVSRPPVLAPITVTVNGKALAFTDVQPVVEGRQPFVPLRPLLAPLGAGELRWDAATQTASLTRGGRLYRLKVGREWATTGRAAIPIEGAPILRQGRMLVPLGAIREVLGAEATWQPEERTVTITTSAPANPGKGAK